MLTRRFDSLTFSGRTTFVVWRSAVGDQLEVSIDFELIHEPDAHKGVNILHIYTLTCAMHMHGIL